MGTNLKKLKIQIRENLSNSDIKFSDLDNGITVFEIDRNKKNLSGSIALVNNKLVLNNINSNYNRNYLKKVVNKALMNTGLSYEIKLKKFTSGDILFLSENNTGKTTIENFYYYGYNDFMDCKERIYYGSLTVRYIGIQERICLLGNYKNFSKYSVV